METGNKLTSLTINNDIYNQLGERWYKAKDDPVALLRAESRTRNPWILNKIQNTFNSNNIKLLDIGCGAGFLSNYLDLAGLNVTGLDASMESLLIAQRYNSPKRVSYILGDAYSLPYEDGSFQVASAMDFLEHVENPESVISEAARILQPKGLFFFSTFNRNFISNLIVIKGVEHFVKNTPPRLHEISYFIKPSELRSMCEKNNLKIVEMHGFVPQINLPFLKMLLTGSINDDFSFRFVRSMLTGYIGIASKEE